MILFKSKIEIKPYKTKKPGIDTNIEITKNTASCAKKNNFDFLGFYEVQCGMRAFMAEGKLKEMGAFPGILRMKLHHMILSHHGNVDGGFESRPKAVKIPEAATLYYADLFDAKVNDFLQEMDREKNLEDPWVYLRGVGSEVYMK